MYSHISLKAILQCKKGGGGGPFCQLCDKLAKIPLRNKIYLLLFIYLIIKVYKI